LLTPAPSPAARMYYVLGRHWAARADKLRRGCGVGVGRQVQRVLDSQLHGGDAEGGGGGGGGEKKKKGVFLR
jgi:hypothetical protein